VQFVGSELVYICQLYGRYKKVFSSRDYECYGPSVDFCLYLN